MSSPALPTDENNYSETEYLMIRVRFDYDQGVSEVAFEGQGDNFDPTNEEMILDILDVAAQSLDYVLIPAENVFDTSEGAPELE